MQGRLPTSAGQARPRIICGPASHLPTSYLRPAATILDLHGCSGRSSEEPCVSPLQSRRTGDAHVDHGPLPTWLVRLHLAPPGSTWVHLATSAVLHLTTCQVHAIQLFNYSTHYQLLFLSLPITKTKKTLASPAAKILRAPAYIDNFLEVPISNDQHTVMVQIPPQNLTSATTVRFYLIQKIFLQHLQY